MEAYISKRKEKIGRFLAEVLSGRAEQLKTVHQLGEQLCGKLVDFTLKGKMLRGGLVAVGYELYAGSNDSITVPLGAVQELFQSALLIHDDIMDRDLSRRGAPSLLGHYVSFARERGLRDAYHTGESLSICAGDIAYFFAFEIFSGIPLENTLKSRLLFLCARELTYVGAAQMVDVLWGADNDAVSLEEIINMYTYKTARYTYALPLVAGAMAAGAPNGEIAALELLGSRMGVLFQIKDDELGLFGDEEKLGKPVGSDIRERKKTLYHHYLMSDPDTKSRERTVSIFGSERLSGDDVGFIRNRVRELEIQQKIDKLVADITDKAEQEIRRLDCSTHGKEFLEQLLSYNSARVR
ncbi:MAG: polyprenyl synthetase family protein [Spirochaetales bacterium]|nr:polyprenyl synthetase family protein [Spirochaetales bacterium]